MMRKKDSKVGKSLDGEMHFWASIELNSSALAARQISRNGGQIGVEVS